MMSSVECKCCATQISDLLKKAMGVLKLAAALVHNYPWFG